ncbi:MAG: hypothetical protein KKD33_09225, partial [Verrucomicrobia bacterium]|nr:hypothetical protein [Verrucomicrobiota bacterium]
APMMIEAGVDVLNLMQPNVFPIPRLAELKGRVCFETCADVQTTLPAGNRAALAAEIREILAACCTKDGGLIEVKLEPIYYDGAGIRRDFGEFCHAEYRRLDPFRRHDRTAS